MQLTYPKDYIGKIICGDCLEIMKGIPDKSIDIVLTDPPYQSPAKYYDTRKNYPKTLADFSLLDNFFTQFFQQLNRILSDKARLYIFCNENSYPLFFVKCYPLFKNIRCLIWDKKTAWSGYTWRHQYEMILLGEKENAPIIKTGDGDVLKFRAVKADLRIHPAEKPIDLLEKILSKHREKLVLDPFLGSGTTILAAKRLKKNFIGIEISPDYVKIAEARLKAIPEAIPESLFNKE